MSSARILAVGLSCLVLAPVSVRADSMWEVAHARANARAGGPISGYDAEMLERWGCLSGTRSRFCKRLSRREKRQQIRAKRRRVRR